MPKLPDPSVVKKELLTLIGERLLVLPENFGTQDDLQEAGLDSMAIIQLLVLLEEKYDVSLPDAALSIENFRSAEMLTKLLQKHAVEA
jgi:acyl carrier protein